MSLLDDVSIVVTPNGYKAGELYAVVPVPTEGAEEVTNGDFTTDLSSWIESTADTFEWVSSWQGESGNLHIVASAANRGARQTGVYTIGVLYKFTAKLWIVSGGVYFGKSSDKIGGVDYTTTGEWIDISVNFNPTADSTLRAYTVASGEFYLDNVSVKEYTAADMDVTRATAATRVDEAGLVNYAEIIGSELVVNGDFATDSDWNKGTGWTISGGKATHTGATGNLSQDVGIGGKTIFLTLDILSIADGVCNVYDINNATTYASFSTTGTKTLYFQSVSNSIGFRSNSTNVSIDNISVKEVTRDNVPRIDYTGGGCPHILAEPQRTNLVTYSEDFSNSAWTKSNSTIATTTETVSPDGTENASKLTVIAVQYSGLYKTLDAASNKYSMSIFAKKGDKDWLYFIDGAGTTSVAWFNISDGTLGTITNGTATINNFGNGWYRCTYSDTNNNSNVYFQIGLADANNSNTPSSGGHSYIWGADKEVGSFPTSYIPTSGSTVTRNQDQFSRDGIGSLINSTEGVLFVEMAALSNDLTYRIISLSDGTDNERIYIQYTNTTNQVSVVVKVGGSTQANIQHTLTDETVFSKMAFKWKANDFAFWIDGVEVGTDTSGSVPSGLNRLALDRQLNTNTFFGKVKQLQVYKTALTDAQLTSLTS